jgi:hypothetical protein
MFDKDERLADKPGRKPTKTKKQKDSKWKQEYKVEKVWENQLGQQLDKKLKIS